MDLLNNLTEIDGFVSEIAKINKGRAFFATPDHLGEYILVDYVANKRKHQKA